MPKPRRLPPATRAPPGTELLPTARAFGPGPRVPPWGRPGGAEVSPGRLARAVPGVRTAERSDRAGQRTALRPRAFAEGHRTRQTVPAALADRPLPVR